MCVRLACPGMGVVIGLNGFSGTPFSLLFPFLSLLDIDQSARFGLVAPKTRQVAKITRQVAKILHSVPY